MDKNTIVRNKINYVYEDFISSEFYKVKFENLKNDIDKALDDINTSYLTTGEVFLKDTFYLSDYGLNSVELRNYKVAPFSPMANEINVLLFCKYVSDLKDCGYFLYHDYFCSYSRIILYLDSSFMPSKFSFYFYSFCSNNSDFVRLIFLIFLIVLTVFLTVILHFYNFL